MRNGNHFPPFSVIFRAKKIGDPICVNLRNLRIDSVLAFLRFGVLAFAWEGCSG
jgi:hypothetical protein